MLTRQSSNPGVDMELITKILGWLMFFAIVFVFVYIAVNLIGAL
jgi:hypothetical protein